MKTPREIILERHQSAEAKLAEIRQEDLAASVRQSPNGCPEETVAAMVVLKFWRESIWPFRRGWLGLTAVWIVIAAANFNTRETRSTRAATQPNQAVLAALQDQRRLMVQLLESAVPTPASSPKPPGPRSEREPERFRKAATDKSTACTERTGAFSLSS